MNPSPEIPFSYSVNIFAGIDDSKFPAYHKQNPKIYEGFKKYAFEAIAKGREYFSAEAIINRLRWDSLVAGNDEFKINNNYKAFYSRMFMNENPEYRGFFRTRGSVYDKTFDNQ